MDSVQSTIVAYLEQVGDPRQERGKVYEWFVLIRLLTAALVAGCWTVAAMVRWMRSHAQELLEVLRPARGRLPSAATWYRLLQQIDLQALEAQVAAHNQALAEADPSAGCVEGAQGQVWQGQAIDGKMIRSASAQGVPIWLVSLVQHESGAVLGQVRVSEKSNEITAVPHLLAGRELRGTVTTMDALLTQRTLAQQILDQGGHYFLVVKKNQPELYEHIELLFRMPPQPWLPGEYQCHQSVEKGHGRLETRTVETSTALNTYLDWPGVGQVVRRTCRRVLLKTGEVQEETHHAITSLSPQEAGAPQCQLLWRRHWTIENRDHYVRDHTMHEDRCPLRSGHAPQALAALRNGLITLLRHHGWSNIAAALDFYHHHLHKALQLIGAAAP